MGDPQDGNTGQPCQSGCFDPPMAHQDDIVFVDDDDAVEAEFADRGRNLVKLLFGVQAGVSRIGL